MTQHDMEQSLEPTGYSHKDCAHGSTRAERHKCRANREELPEDLGKLVRTRELLRSQALELGVDSEVTQLDYSNVDVPRLVEDIKRLRKAIEPAQKAEWDLKHQARIAEQEAVAERAHKIHLRSVALEQASRWASGEGWTGTAVQVVAAAQVFEHYLATGAQMDPEQTVDVFVSAKATSDAVRAGKVPGA